MLNINQGKILNLEKPFLEELHQAHGQVIDQGQGIPIDSAKLLRVIYCEENNGSMNF